MLALDVGGTGIKAGLVTGDGELTRTWRRATDLERGPRAVIDTIIDFAAELLVRAAADGPPVVAAGFALPGIVDEQTGTGVFSATIGWRDVPFRTLLTSRLGVPVAIGHDVRAGGVAAAARYQHRRRDHDRRPAGSGTARNGRRVRAHHRSARRHPLRLRPERMPGAICVGRRGRRPLRRGDRNGRHRCAGRRGPPDRRRPDSRPGLGRGDRRARRCAADGGGAVRSGPGGRRRRAGRGRRRADGAAGRGADGEGDISRAARAGHS
ncbi:MAG: ROK family protein [Catenulisporales bacterium]|nr:ROK family protein [Catenulisporales bacterium]